MKPRKQTQIIHPEDILLDHTPAIRQLCNRLREIVRAAVPDASEAAYPVWHAIGFRHPRVGYFCGIFPSQDTVKLLFEWGVLLPDPRGVLQGDGKQTRHIELRSEEQIPIQAIGELIAAALALPGDRKTRQWLVQNGAQPIKPYMFFSSFK